MTQEIAASVEAKSLTAQEQVEEEPSMWETVRGVFFVLGVAAALTLSFTILHVYEMGFTSASCSHSVANASAEQQTEKEKMAEKQSDYLLAAARTGQSHVMAA